LGFVCLGSGALLAIVAGVRALRAFRPSEMDFLPLLQP
jgi:hypothetical protein